jgi:hypothetical protein
VATGKRQATWKLPGATALGHALAAESRDSVLVIDSSAGSLVRLTSEGIKNQSPHLGEEVSEASLPE